jgi:hypothetical protein
MGNKELLKIDLCGRLTHGVNIETTNGIGEKWVGIFNEVNVLMAFSQNTKPVLYPLSSLTKEITVKGYNNDKPFNPIDEINRLASLDKNISQSIEWDFSEDHFLINIDFFLGGWECYFVSDLLNKWHIDYRGLIDKGLAIDVNTLETNPYVK